MISTKITFLYLIVGFFFFHGCDQTMDMQVNSPPPNSQIDPDRTFIEAQKEKPTIVPGRYVVVFNDQGGRQISEQAAEEAEQRIQSIFSDFNIAEDSLIHQYKFALKGFAARLSEEQVQELEKDTRVGIVAPDVKYKAIQVLPSSAPEVIMAKRTDTVPWGVARLGGPTRIVGRKAWIIDTGIDLNHPDLNVDLTNSKSFVQGKQYAEDEEGHGTHVAGIIAAKEDFEGIVGVAANAVVVAIRVCDENGYCYTSDAKAGIDEAASKYSAGDVANISLGWPVSGSSYIDTALSILEDAIKTAADDGLMFTIAAGNSDEHASNISPARIVNQNVWTVSAYDEYDDFWVYSNFGNPPIYFGGPGVNVLSLAIGGGTTTLTGTSMAAPHIAGLLLVVPNNIGVDGTVNNDPDNDPDLIAVNGNSFPGLSVSLSGPSILDSGEEGTWTANANNGTGMYTYQWYYQNDSGSPWQTGGTNSSYSHTFYNTNNDPIYAAVKVVVEDGFSDPVEGYEFIYIEGDCTDPMTCPGW